MLEAAKSTLLILSALFPIVNPLGGSPIFLTLTRDYSASARRALSRRVALNSFFLLVSSCLVGTHILSFFGISLPVVQVGGGLIVISTGWAILNRSDDEDDQREGKVHKRLTPRDQFSNAFYPLTLPLTVGPGSISVAITLGANVPHRLALECLGIVCGAHRLRDHRHQHLPLLRFFRSARARAGSYGHGRDHAPLFVSIGLHRRADSLEWR